VGELERAAHGRPGTDSSIPITNSLRTKELRQLKQHEPQTTPNSRHLRPSRHGYGYSISSIRPVPEVTIYCDTGLACVCNEVTLH
jgi:hypothetical protein